MIRRKFIQGLSCGLAAVAPATAREIKTVNYRIEGFTCVTCAVGLDTMLGDLKGVVKSKSSYPARSALIEFNPNVITESQIQTFIFEETGFKVSVQPKTSTDQ